MSRAIGIIPARYGSSRLPGKPLLEINGAPLIEHVYRRASRATRLQRLLVATDDHRILAAVSSFGGEAVMTSPHHTNGTDRVAEAARQLQLPGEAIIVNIQGDEPLLEPAVVDDLIAALEQRPEVSMATVAYPDSDVAAFHDPDVVKVVLDRQGQALYFSRAPIPASAAGSRTPLYYKHLGLYGYRNGFLQQFSGLARGQLEKRERLEQLRALEHGFPILVALSSFDSVGVDTERDLELVRKILAEQSGG